MKIGFSTLSLFMKSIDEILNIAEKYEFDMIELLCEGPYIPYNLLKHQEYLEGIDSHNIEINLHGPAVDLNLASLNSGIRNESTNQIYQTIDLANLIGANIITVHPGQIGRPEERLREIALKYATESIDKCVKYSKENSTKVKISVENLPERFSFLCNRPEELEKIQKVTNCCITIDTGHANTCKNPEDFFNLKNIAYYHLNDNNGIKDQHKTLGEGNLNLNLLKKVHKGIIELNNYDNVLKSKKVIKKMNLI